MKRKVTLLLICFAKFLTFMKGQSITDVKSLYKDLFTDYTKEVMPRSNTTQALIVGVYFHLININAFREVDETISITGALVLNWTDPSLAWNPYFYGNLQTIIVDPKDLWIPPTFLVNRVDKMESLGSDTKFYTMLVWTGQVFYFPGDVFESKCPTDIAMFPFDTQICTLGFLSWGIPNDRMKFSSVYDKAKLDHYEVNSDWNLKEYSTSVVNKHGADIFTVTLKIKRQPLYYVIMVIVPTLLFSFLNPLVFMLPTESGERVSLAMTILLSYAIFLTLVSAAIPTSSNPMCLLLIFMMIIILISGVIVYGVIISTKFYHEEDSNEIGSALKRLVKWRLKEKRTEVAVVGKDVAKMLDSFFFFTSYIAIILLLFGSVSYVILKQ